MVDSFFIIGSLIAFRRVVFLGNFADLVEFEALSKCFCEDDDVPEIDVGRVADLGGTNDDVLIEFVSIN